VHTHTHTHTHTHLYNEQTGPRPDARQDPCIGSALVAVAPTPGAEQWCEVVGGKVNPPPALLFTVMYQPSLAHAMPLEAFRSPRRGETTSIESSDVGEQDSESRQTPIFAVTFAQGGFDDDE
jgi:hypothetical protein